MKRLRIASKTFCYIQGTDYMTTTFTYIYAIIREERDAQRQLEVVRYIVTHAGTKFNEVDK